MACAGVPSWPAQQQRALRRSCIHSPPSRSRLGAALSARALCARARHKAVLLAPGRPAETHQSAGRITISAIVWGRQRRDAAVPRQHWRACGIRDAGQCAAQLTRSLDGVRLADRCAYRARPIRVEGDVIFRRYSISAHARLHSAMVERLQRLRSRIAGSRTTADCRTRTYSVTVVAASVGGRPDRDWHDTLGYLIPQRNRCVSCRSAYTSRT